MLTLTATQRLLQRIDIVMLGLLVTPKLVGIFSLAAMISDSASLASRPTLAYFSPRVARFFAQGNGPALRREFWHASIFISVVHAVSALAIGLALPYVLPYFGAEFVRAYDSTIMMLAAIVLTTLFGPLGNLMMMTRYEDEAMKITMVTAAVNILLNPLMIHLYSIEGAAMATSAVIVLKNVIFAYVVWKKRILHPA